MRSRGRTRSLHQPGGPGRRGRLRRRPPDASCWSAPPTTAPGSSPRTLGSRGSLTDIVGIRAAEARCVTPEVVASATTGSTYRQGVYEFAVGASRRYRIDVNPRSRRCGPVPSQVVVPHQANLRISPSGCERRASAHTSAETAGRAIAVDRSMNAEGRGRRRTRTTCRAPATGPESRPGKYAQMSCRHTPHGEEQGGRRGARR